MPRGSSYQITCLILLLLLVSLQGLYLHHVPGLMGDEASEGENVWQLLDTKKLTVLGERSYIGPLIDYVRLPIMMLGGYSALALRLPMVVASVLTFIMAAMLLPRWLKEGPALLGLVGIFFSPIYLSQQRLGWAITLLPFCTVLTIWVATRSWRHAPLLAGLAGGLGVSNHLLFLPTFASIIILKVVSLVRTPRILGQWWPALVGFMAGFGTQAAVLLLYPEDQGDPAEVGGLAGERWRALPRLLPLVLSGSSYVARYTGEAFSLPTIWLVCTCLIALWIVALLLRSVRRVGLWLAAGLMIHLSVLLLLIDRFTLRYFVVFTLGVWLLAGMGLGGLIDRLFPKFPRVPGIGAVMAALILSTVFIQLILLPFLASGGSLNAFSLGNRTDSAAALVDVRPLVQCLEGAGPVGSENVHIWNRLQFLSHSNQKLEIVSQEAVVEADWLVTYRQPEIKAVPGERCPELTHFAVTPGPGGNSRQNESQDSE